MSIKPEPVKKKRKLSPASVVFLIRWWTAGAVYFLFGWGTSMGKYTSTLDLIFSLGVVLGLVQSFVLVPAFKMLYGIGPAQPYKELNFGRKLLRRLSHVIEAVLTVTIVTGIYGVINRLGQIILDREPGTVILPGEPILFGLFFAGTILLVDVVIDRVFRRREKK